MSPPPPSPSIDASARLTGGVDRVGRQVRHLLLDTGADLRFQHAVAIGGVDPRQHPLRAGRTQGGALGRTDRDLRTGADDRAARRPSSEVRAIDLARGVRILGHRAGGCLVAGVDETGDVLDADQGAERGQGRAGRLRGGDQQAEQGSGMRCHGAKDSWMLPIGMRGRPDRSHRALRRRCLALYDRVRARCAGRSAAVCR
ncbi:MAG: hypothetical protein NVV68_18260 [Dokdonella sp.]|nr:hypothetical protein [Dokdonella sp.]